MFARPRPKKTLLRPPPKKRKVTHSIEEISFDNDARADYLTGFHKRKLQRIKHAQEEAAKKAKQEKIDMRKQLRDDRRKEVEEHVHNVNQILKEAQRAGHISDNESSEGETEEWQGFGDPAAGEVVNHEEEYIDEDRYTTVTVESVNVSREGLTRTGGDSSEEEDDGTEQKRSGPSSQTLDAARPRKEWPKTKKQKFRYESKTERSLDQRKLKAKKKMKTRP